MVSFKASLLNKELFVSGLEKRGFSEDIPDEKYEGEFSFTRIISKKIQFSLNFTPSELNTFRCGLIVSSLDVQNIFCKFGLFLDRPIIPADSFYDVLASELLWLRWNEDANSADKYKCDYSLVAGAGIGRLFEDLDSVGEMFMSQVNTPGKLADFLMSIETYPNRIKWGGRPKSSDPFIFASSIYFANGDCSAAVKALDIGFKKYKSPTPGIEWQAYRFEKFEERRKLLLAEIAKPGAAVTGAFPND